MADNLKTQPVPKVYPFDRENIQKITGDPQVSVSRAAISSCPICGKIPERVRPTEHGHLPETAARLEEQAELGTRLRLLRCPLCGCFYKLERRTELLPGGEGGESLTRLQPAEALEFILAQKAKAILRQGDRWVLMW
jgi:hypothetical protein